MDKTNYTIIATLGNDLERIIAANCLDDDELEIAEQVIVSLFDKCDALYSMPDEERNEYELNGGEMYVPYPFFILDNTKHRDLLCYIELADIGIKLNLFDLPNAFNRYDTINLLETVK